MKVLVVTQYFWPENFRINDLVKSLAKKGVEVDVLTGKPNYPEGKIFPGYRFWGREKEEQLGASVYRIPLIPRGTGGKIRLSLNYLSFVFFGILFAPWLLRKRKYDAIFVFAPSPILQALPALLLGKLKRCNVILWVQDLWPESLSATGYVRNPVLLNLIRFVVQFIYRHSDLLLVQSRAFEKEIAALAPGKPIKYYPNSAGEIFARPPKNATVPEGPRLSQGFSVVFAGNIGTAQAVEIILEAATLLKEHSKISFVMIGQGSRLSWMKEQVQLRGLTNLHLLGHFPLDSMPMHMQNASVLLVTLADQPIFRATVPSKVQAYMAAGRPILACLNGEGAHLVTEANAGLAVPAEDTQALADGVLRLFQLSEQEREELGKNGRRYFEQNFDHELLVDELIGHFKTASSLRRSQQ